MLPGMSGLDVCRALRADHKTAAIPIIMVTAKADEGDRISGLELGADDYVSKPFSPNELMARVRALFRRMQRTETDTRELTLGSIAMELATHVVSLDGAEFLRRQCALRIRQLRRLALLRHAAGFLQQLQGLQPGRARRTVSRCPRRVRPAQRVRSE